MARILRAEVLDLNQFGKIIPKIPAYNYGFIFYTFISTILAGKNLFKHQNSQLHVLMNLFKFTDLISLSHPVPLFSGTKPNKC